MTTIGLPLNFDQNSQMFIPKSYCSYQRLGSFQLGNITRILGSILLSATAITSETELVLRKNIDAVSYTIHLSLPMKRVRGLKGRMQLLYGSVIFN